MELSSNPFWSANELWQFATELAAATDIESRRKILRQFAPDNDHPQTTVLSQMRAYVKEVGSVDNIPTKDREYLEEKANAMAIYFKNI